MRFFVSAISFLLFTYSAFAGDSYLSCYKSGEGRGDDPIAMTMISFEQNPGTSVSFVSPKSATTNVFIALEAKRKFLWNATVYATDSNIGGVSKKQIKSLKFFDWFSPIDGVDCMIAD